MRVVYEHVDTTLWFLFACDRNESTEIGSPQRGEKRQRFVGDDARPATQGRESANARCV